MVPEIVVKYYNYKKYYTEKSHLITKKVYRGIYLFTDIPIDEFWASNSV